MAGLKDIIHPNPFRRLTEGKAGLQRLAAADAAAVRERRKRLVWDKGIRVRNLNPNEWRRDAHGNLICFADYGNRNSDHGWEIDHITPRLLGGSDDIDNLRPLQWEANARRGSSLLDC